MADVSPQPEGYRTLQPYLAVDGATDAIEFYTTVFGAHERMRIPMPDGRVGHAELELGDSLLMISDEYLEMGVRGPRAIGGSPVTLSIYVGNADEVVERSLEAGATLRRPVETQFYGDRSGQIEDPWGHIWNVATHVEDVAPEEMARRADEVAAEAEGGGGG